MTVAGLTMVSSSPAAAVGFHRGDVCSKPTKTCAASASFIKKGDHLLIWDNKKDGRSAVVQYQRSDGPPTFATAWNNKGAGHKVDFNLNIPESGWIYYAVCLGEFGPQKIYQNTCSYKTENAS